MDIRVLQSPAGHPVRRKGNELVCSGTGKRYAIENGTPQLFDEADVSPFLRRDYEPHRVSSQLGDTHGDEQWQATKDAYRRARFINSEIMYQLAYHRRMRVLELGVGSADLISRFGRMGHQAWALDFYPWEMQKARDADPVFDTISAPMARLPFRDASFDMIYFHAALHHALPADAATFEWSAPSNLLDAVRELRRILKPDGVLFLLGEGLYPEGIEDRYHERACQEDPHLVYESWYTLTEYEEIFRRAGIFPHLWVDQDAMILRAHSYTRAGERVTLVTEADHITEGNYDTIIPLVRDRLRPLLPDWVGLGETRRPPPVWRRLRSAAGRRARGGLRRLRAALSSA